MKTEIFRFKIGLFECLTVCDGTYTYRPPIFPPPATFLFANAPKERLVQKLYEHNLQLRQWDEWVSPYLCMVIDTGEHRVLVDTGADGLGPNTGKLLKNLQSEMIAPEDIDVVIITHGHPDHICGITLRGGKLAFPNARYIMWKGEWDFWTSEQAEQKLSEHVKEVLLKAARKNLPPIRNQLDLVDHETEIVPGIHAVAASGHTPGHMAVEISSRGEQLLHIADAMLHPIHLEQPEWYATVDLVPELVPITRLRLIDRAVAENALVFASHFSFPGLGHVVQKRKGWHWEPIKTMEFTQN